MAAPIVARMMAAEARNEPSELNRDVDDVCDEISWYSSSLFVTDNSTPYSSKAWATTAACFNERFSAIRTGMFLTRLFAVAVA